MEPARAHYTVADYVRLEAYSNVRHEFLDGQMFAMAGGTPEHGLWAANVIGLLAGQLRSKPCRTQTSDVRIRVPATGLTTYPDVSVVCGHIERDKDDTDAVCNPVVIVEILSPSTESYDRGEKLANYKQLESLQEILFVSHDSQRIDVVRRDSGAWQTETALVGQSVRLHSLDCEISVNEVYRDPFA